MTINARPNLNGNSIGDFEAAALSLQHAAEALSEALRATRMSVTHGRNYQHLADAATAGIARELDEEKLHSLNLAMNAAQKLAEDIQRAAT